MANFYRKFDDKIVSYFLYNTIIYNVGTSTLCTTTIIPNSHMFAFLVLRVARDIRVHPKI